MKKTLIAVVALALTLSACAADPDAKPSGNSEAAASQTTTATTDDAPLDRSEFDTAAVTTDNWLEYGSLRPQAVRTGVHDGYERVVVEYDGAGKLGWKTTGWAAEARQPGSGFPIELGGKRALQIVISGVTYPEGVADASGNANIPDLSADLTKGTQLTGIEVDQPFEGLHTVTLGANSGLKYRITSMSQPTRLIIDLLTE
ncbi:MAG: hypothetical protein Q4E03_05445 [Trueperella sp.]|nr:hypothetical protein [Trueperella sp.]